MIKKYIAHLTINTGDLRRSFRSEISMEAIKVCKQMLSQLDNEAVQLRDGYIMQGDKSANHFYIEIFKNNDRDKDKPLVAVACALSSLASVKTWCRINSRSDLIAPAAPWVAAKLYPTANYYLDLFRWVGDFEACLAWALNER